LSDLLHFTDSVSSFVKIYLGDLKPSSTGGFSDIEGLSEATDTFPIDLELSRRTRRSI